MDKCVELWIDLERVILNLSLDFAVSVKKDYLTGGASGLAFPLVFSTPYTPKNLIKYIFYIVLFVM